MNIYVDQNYTDDLVGDTLTQGLISEGHTVFNQHNGNPYSDENLDLVVTTKLHSGDWLPPAPTVYVGEEYITPETHGCFVHENPSALYGILEGYYHTDTQHKLSLLRRSIDVCIFGNEDDEYYQRILRKFPYSNIVRLPERYTNREPLIRKEPSNSKVVVVPYTDTSYKCSLWRALASGAVLVVENPLGYSIFPPINKKHTYSFDNTSSLLNEISNIIADPLQHQHIADAAWNSGKRYHTSRIRGRQFIMYVSTKMQRPQKIKLSV